MTRMHELHSTFIDVEDTNRSINKRFYVINGNKVNKRYDILSKCIVMGLMLT